MFTHPCFIRKNTPELKKKLEELGYIMGESLNTNKSKGLICTKYGKVFNIICNADISKYDINCGTNEELFLALAALRDDTDKNQWFANNKNDWYKCLDDKFIKETANWVLCASAENWHKATVEEIIEHFKDERCTKNTIK
jgi:hypothetical protein